MAHTEWHPSEWLRHLVAPVQRVVKAGGCLVDDSSLLEHCGSTQELHVWFPVTVLPHNMPLNFLKSKGNQNKGCWSAVQFVVVYTKPLVVFVHVSLFLLDKKRSNSHWLSLSFQMGSVKCCSWLLHHADVFRPDCHVCSRDAGRNTHTSVSSGVCLFDCLSA